MLIDLDATFLQCSRGFPSNRFPVTLRVRIPLAPAASPRETGHLALVFTLATCRSRSRWHNGAKGFCQGNVGSDREWNYRLRDTVSVRATPQERKRSLPADLLIPEPAAIVMHAVTIAASPECVWPWLVQMGAGRAGWYSYDWIDNDGHPSATEIIPALQHVAPGDVLPSLPGVKESFIVAAVQPGRDLILTVPAPGGGLLVSWEFFLEPLAQLRTRLLVRGRVSSQWPPVVAGEPAAPARSIEHVYALLARLPRWLMGPVALFGHGIMQARQLRGIKRRAERTRL